MLSASEGVTSAEIVLKHPGVCLILGIYVQNILSGSPHPFGRDRDETEYKGLDAAGGLQPESLQVMSADEQLIEIPDECREDEEDGILGHERPRQPLPSETVVEVIEDALPGSALVVELHHFPVRGLVVVRDDATVGVLALPDVKFLAGHPRNAKISSYMDWQRLPRM